MLKNAAAASEVVDLSAKVGELIEDIMYRMILGRCKDDKFDLKPLIHEGIRLLGTFNLADFVPFLAPLDLQNSDAPFCFDSLVDKRVESPWLFELCNPVTGKTSHCGVLEFTSDEGFVLLPAPMMESMELEEGELVTLKSASLDKGTFLKLQPHTKNFMQLSDPKAVLEKAFRDFCCLTTGDTIMIMHNDIKFYIDIVEAKPSLAVNIIDTDCEVDFALPLDYEPPQKKQKKAKVLQKQEQPIEVETVKFKAFNGIARRLDGEPVTEQVAVDDDHDWMMNAERKPCGSKKVVLGSNVIQSQ
ncbi:hypothetical protein POUND7_006266 [Theobroma cacao]